MNSFLLKTEPSTYSWEDLVLEKRTVWDGVANAQALIVLRSMKRGDEALIYHSNTGKEIVGVAKVVKQAYPDPNLDDPKRIVVDIRAVRALERPITLAEIKAVKGLSDLALVRQSRLSCMPVSKKHRAMLVKLGL